MRERRVTILRAAVMLAACWPLLAARPAAAERDTDRSGPGRLWEAFPLDQRPAAKPRIDALGEPVGRSIGTERPRPAPDPTSAPSGDESRLAVPVTENRQARSPLLVPSLGFVVVLLLTAAIVLGARRVRGGRDRWVAMSSRRGPGIRYRD
jgi:hypothetical protein